MARKAIDMTGQRFGKLLCVAPLGSTSTGMRWECKCDCGNTTSVVRGNLISGSTTSCGCVRLELIKNNQYTLKHGRTKRINGKKVNRVGTYSTWEAMINRCYNSNSNWYHRYGGRGIKVCDRWRNSFENFLADMGERPKGKTIDRINPNGHYEPENCKWSTPKEQAINKC